MKYYGVNRYFSLDSVLWCDTIYIVKERANDLHQLHRVPPSDPGPDDGHLREHGLHPLLTESGPVTQRGGFGPLTRPGLRARPMSPHQDETGNGARPAPGLVKSGGAVSRRRKTGQGSAALPKSADVSSGGEPKRCPRTRPPVGTGADEPTRGETGRGKMTDLVRQGEPRWQTSFGPIDRGMGSSDVRINVRHLTETCAGAFKAGTLRKSEDGDQWYVCVDPADPGAKVLMARGLALPMRTAEARSERPSMKSLKPCAACRSTYCSRWRGGLRPPSTPYRGCGPRLNEPSEGETGDQVVTID